MFSSVIVLLVIFGIILLVSLVLKILRLGVALVIIAGVAALIWRLFIKKGKKG